MPPSKRYDDVISSRHPKGTRDQIKASLADGERPPDFMRVAVEEELKRRGVVEVDVK